MRTWKYWDYTNKWWIFRKEQKQPWQLTQKSAGVADRRKDIFRSLKHLSGMNDLAPVTLMSRPGSFEIVIPQD